MTNPPSQQTIQLLGHTLEVPSGAVSGPTLFTLNILPTGGPGQAQVITTRTLMIYGTGRQGLGGGQGQARLFAVDKATGKQVGAVRIPSRTTAVPMTFLHDGKQYIVFATGQGRSTSLVALTLPR